MSDEQNQHSLFPEPQEAVTARIDAQIAFLLLGHAGGPLNLHLEHAEREVLRRLRYQRGVANAMPIRELEQLTGLKPRDIKQVIRTLRLNFHLPIGSSKHSGTGGYYLMVTKEDQSAWVKTVVDQIRAEAEVVSAAAGKQARLELIGQLALEVQQ